MKTDADSNTNKLNLLFAFNYNIYVQCLAEAMSPSSERESISKPHTFFLRPTKTYSSNHER